MGRAFAMLVLVETSACGGHPSDQKLASVFQEHRLALEELVRMSNEDRNVVRIAPTFTRLANDWSWPRPAAKLGITIDRWQHYLNLFRETGVEEGLERSEKPEVIFFIASARGFVTGGSSKGYAYRTTPPDLLYNSLDARPPQLSSDDVGFKSLDGNWYIFFTWAH